MFFVPNISFAQDDNIDEFYNQTFFERAKDVLDKGVQKTKNGFNTAKNKTKRGYKNLKKKLKKQEAEKKKMVETSDEWKELAKNVPLNQRELKDVEYPKSDKNNYIPKPYYIFEKYNYPQGKREPDLTTLKKNLTLTGVLVTDSNVEVGAYVEYYFSPSSNQTSSALFVEELDTTRGKKDRIINFKPEQKERIPAIESGTDETYKNLFSALSIVDWSKDNKRLLVKEKIGSHFGGIYKTYLYVYYLAKNGKESYAAKLYDLDDTIKNYFRVYEKLPLEKYRYDIKPLGFSAAEDDIIILLCYVYDKQNNKVFLGTFGYDTITSEVMLLSKTDESNYISANGLILKQIVQ